MKVLQSWLYDYVEWTGEPAELARILTEVGFPVVSVETLGRRGEGPVDHLLEVEVTSNRGDCLSHLGIAREVAASLGQPFRPVVQPSEPPPAEGGADAAPAPPVPVAVEAPDLCPAYLARALAGVDNRRPTPPWIARRLAALGVRPVNAVVDITNFVLLARGQPLHAFDRATLRGGRIVVRRSREGESIETIDGRVRRLPAGLLVIADAERPVAVAGVMGSRDTEVGPGTKEVVLESARFAPAAVRASAAALGLATEASARFSRRVDPAEMATASLRALALLLETVGGAADGEPSAAGPEAAAGPAGARVALRFSRLQRLLGTEAIPAEEVRAVLASLRFEVEAGDGEGVTVRVPSYRGDVTLEEDLVEEVARVRGYGCIPAALSLPVRPVPPSRDSRVMAAVRAALVGEGFHEALTLPFVAGGPPDDASPWTSRPAVRVLNPTREEEPFLRRSLLGPLLRGLERNRARGVPGTRLFEVSRVFLPAAEEGAAPEEPRRIGGVLEGGYADARGGVDAVLEALGLSGAVAVGEVPEEALLRPLDPARSGAFLLDGRTVGYAGEVREEALAALSVHREGLAVAAFELDLEALAAAGDLDPPVRPVPVHPVVSRDLAVVLPPGVRWSAVEESVRGAAGRLLRGLEPFDEYRGKGIPAGHRSLAFRLTFGSPDRTLTGEEVDGAVAAVVGALEKDLGGRLRG